MTVSSVANHAMLIATASFLSMSCTVALAQDMELGGIVTDVTHNGLIQFYNGHRLLTVRQWGLHVTDPDALEELAVGRWIDCLLISEEQGPTVDTTGENLGDCRISPTDAYPQMLKNYMDLLTWAPILAIGEHSCDGSSFGGTLTLTHRRIGDVTYSCWNGVPRLDTTIFE